MAGGCRGQASPVCDPKDGDRSKILHTDTHQCAAVGPVLTSHGVPGSGHQDCPRGGCDSAEPYPRPLNSLTASNIATMFATGVPACTLWIESNTKPPPSEKISQRSITSRRTSAGAPNGKVCCVSTPPPQKTSLPLYFAFSIFGSMPLAEHWTGLMMSMPASIIDSKNRSDEPQECLKIFQVVFLWIQLQSAA